MYYFDNDLIVVTLDLDMVDLEQGCRSIGVRL